MNQALNIGETLSLGWASFTREAVALIVGFVIFALVAGISMGICAGPMLVGYNQMCLRAARGEHIEIGDIFKGFQSFGPSFILMLLTGIIVGIGMMLCVIPGIVAAFLLCWAFWLMAEGDNDPMSCIRRSLEYSKENIGPVLVFMIVAGVVSSIGSIVALGSLVTGPVSSMMVAHGFMRAFGSGGSVAEQPIATV